MNEPGTPDNEAFPPVSKAEQTRSAPPTALPLRLYSATRLPEGFSVRAWLDELPWGMMFWLTMGVLLIALLYYVAQYVVRVQNGEKIRELTQEVAEHSSALEAAERQRAEYRRRVAETFAGSDEEPDWNYVTFRATGIPFADDLGARMLKGARLPYQEQDAQLGIRIDQLQLLRDGVQSRQMRMQRAYQAPRAVPIAVTAGAMVLLAVIPFVLWHISERA